MKKITITIFLAILLIFSGCRKYNSNRQIVNDTNRIPSVVVTSSEAEIKSPEPSETQKPLPEYIKIQVPFTSQAPFAVWDADHNEACEEASILLAKEFQNGNTENDLDKTFADLEIINMIAWQRTNWGGHFDLDINQTKNLAEAYYGLTNLQIATINSVDDIKKYLADGKIIIAPTAGRELGNPHFTQPGPVYHMLIITGYNNENFITNDVGIWQGRDWEYQYDVLFNSIRDLPEEAKNQEHYIKNHPELIDSGEKKIIIISK